MRSIRAVAAAVALMAVLALNTPAATASTGGVQRQVNQVLASYPDARQAAQGTVAFPDGVLLTIPKPGAKAGRCTESPGSAPKAKWPMALRSRCA